MEFWAEHQHIPAECGVLVPQSNSRGNPIDLFPKDGSLQFLDDTRLNFFLKPVAVNELDISSMEGAIAK
jgi:hypothetical protein